MAHLTNFVCFPYHNETAGRARDGTSHQQQVVFRVDFGNLQIADGRLGRAVLARHFLSLEDAPWVGVHPSTTSVAMALFDTVGSALSGKVVPFHDARESTPLAIAGDIDGLDAFEDCRGDFGTHFHRGLATQLAYKPLGLAIWLGNRRDTCGRQPFGSLAADRGNLAAF